MTQLNGIQTKAKASKKKKKKLEALKIKKIKKNANKMSKKTKKSKKKKNSLLENETIKITQKALQQYFENSESDDGDVNFLSFTATKKSIKKKAKKKSKKNKQKKLQKQNSPDIEFVLETSEDEMNKSIDSMEEVFEVAESPTKSPDYFIDTTPESVDPNEEKLKEFTKEGGRVCNFKSF